MKFKHFYINAMRSYSFVSKCAILFFTLTVTGGGLSAQRYSGKDADAICKGSTLVVIEAESKAPTMILLGEETNYQATAWKEVLKPVLGMREEDDLKEYKARKDMVGFAHHFFRQMYKGLKVQGGEYVIHEKLGRIISFSGLFIENVNVKTDPAITQAEALKIALKHVGAKQYKWELPEEEAKYRKKSKDSAATYYPVPELVIASRNLDLKKRDLRLCFRVEIFASDPMSHAAYFVDALLGVIIGKENL
jgi:Zn-dependent metalloprotease